MRKENIVYGKHVVALLLQHYPHLVLELHTTKPNFGNNQLETLKRSIKIKALTPQAIKIGALEAVNHQGIVALVANYPYLPGSQCLTQLEGRTQDLILVLDKIQDPQNFGTIIRSAALLGVKNLIISQHQQALVTSAVIKASAGTAYLLKITVVANLNQVINQLKKKGYGIYSSNLNQEALDLRQIDFAPKTVLIIGNEHYGVSQLLTRNSDINLFIPTTRVVDSLNVATATALALFYISSQLGLI